MIACYAGSFDPPTLGHEDIIARSAKLFEKVVVLISANPAKKGFLEEEERLRLLEEICAPFDNVIVKICPGLTVETAREYGAGVLVRSMRNAADYEGEVSLAWVNGLLEDGMDTLFLPGDPAYSYISSTAVRDLLRFGQSIAALVPQPVFQALQPELAAESEAAK
ncbi:pantetheine-phosphate adenylyltransferase [Allobaculum mucilyticum]|uniref:pantetheine-phosphate adenylyltransferase n=1 Tax=Allobaculum mucilyticum TaxID=2834459 RepID=UPI001E3BE6B4|nr:pantetheine-phosphate adenylyltransferase [Allobaculum mucilyticum]UNT95368.1 pantetheine-phosphate adenylyltransferase [Allobaculum mucilyticum]